MKNLAAGRLPLIITLVMAGCSPATASNEAEAQHREIVCLDGLARCDPAIRGHLFEEWQASALYHPGSTFAVWLAGRDRGSVELHLVARVPSAWGPDVMSAQARFLEHARQQATATKVPPSAERRFPAGALPAAATEPGKHELIVVGASRQSIDTSAQRAPHHRGVICDRSSSTLGHSCNANVLEHAFTRWLADGGLVPDSSFSIWVPGAGRDSTALSLSISTPPGPPGFRAAALLGADQELRSWARQPAQSDGSAIAEAISVAAENLRNRRGRRSLMVLSDMRQHTPRRWDFERQVPEPEVFVAWLRTQALLADLCGVSVSVCGMHHRRGPGAGPFDAQQAERVKIVWMASFTAMGIALEPRQFAAQCRSDER